MDDDRYISSTTNKEATAVPQVPGANGINTAPKPDAMAMASFFILLWVLLVEKNNRGKDHNPRQQYSTLVQNILIICCLS